MSFLATVSVALVLQERTVVRLQSQTAPTKTAAKQKATNTKPMNNVDQVWDKVDTNVARQVDIWFDSGDFPKSIQGLKFQFAYSPNDYEVVTNLGYLLESTNQNEDALYFYNQYVALNPRDPDARFPAGNLYFKKKDYLKTIQVLEPTLTKGKPHPNSFRIVAKSYERLKKYSDAIRVWEMQIKAFPDDLPAMANIRRVKEKIASGG